MRIKSVRAGLALVAALVSLPAWALPDFATVKAGWRSSDVILLDRHGQPLQRVRVDQKQRKLDWVTLPEISPAMRQALVVSEDRNFYSHSGVDWSAVAAASWGNVWNKRTRGASTLTMQLVGLLDDDLKRGNQGRSLGQKVQQGWSAEWLERRWTKAQILEGYLNLVGFRGEIVGLDALSASLFDKAPSGLDAHESAIAVALLRAPNSAPDKVGLRACGILKDMGRPADCDQLRVEAQIALARHGNGYQQDEQLAPHFARKLLARSPLPAGTVVRTTLDADLQRFATLTLRRQLSELRQRNVEDGALVVLDNRSGDILAWVGSSGDLSRAGDVDGVTALRQAGSTLKPFLYQLALQGHWLTAASLLNDSPLDLNTSSGLYAPQNYDKDFKGPVSVRTALASSLNTPAVRTIEMVTPARLRERLYTLGMTSLNEAGDYYGYSLALGAADIRLLDLANAYRTLATGGTQNPLRWLGSDPKPGSKRVLDEQSSFIISDILSDRTARARTFGLESALATRFWTAVKTGTSKDMRDNWAVGYSQRYTVATWVGNASGAPMWDVSGMHGAAPVWLAVMNQLHTGTPSLLPTPPAGIQAQQIRFEDNIEASRREYFLPGTARDEIYLARDDARDRPAGISYPVEGAIFALDPDIPPANQRIVFRANGTARPQWWLNGKPLGRGQTLAWFPMPGRHVLELRDNTRSVEQVHFEVRGAFLRQTPPRKGAGKKT
ncbi:penicillin-binding protein 1C [Silvimonas terrae]|uniref:peptidoglycan glycosyltransferase n=1 Tax=Silvimonas terrae TaxID=300266 RepID=A0A840RIK5_9NEIS|nr:penicillin-binding protein 1C [Silvimonas terrae]MBB5193145.1 penicillin-binding protein 1C [Silvimonas terrae]